MKRTYRALLCLLLIAATCLCTLVPGAALAKTPTPSPPPAYTALSLGDEGDDVLFMQQALTALGYITAENQTGVYGNTTQLALKGFQKANKLKQTGEADTVTLAALYDAAALVAPVATAAPAAKEVSSGKGEVWIPTKGGKKYHSRETCSGMYGPLYVTVKEAEKLGFTPCKKCYK